MLAQGGEVAFVLLSLASELKVLPQELNRLLIIVVVISMALTPGLASVGKYLADRADDADNSASGQSPAHIHQHLHKNISSYLMTVYLSLKSLTRSRRH